MKIKVLQKGFNFSQDGPGNRLVYHLQGCCFKCPWCSNPESIPINGALITGDSINFDCPYGAAASGTLDRSICQNCTAKECLSCHSSGIKLSCSEHDTSELLDEALRSSLMFFDGGGVTFTGGEATMQFDALKELMVALHEKGISVALETNGSASRLPELFPYIDFLMFDCKHYDSEKHRQVLGADNSAVKENLRLASHNRNQLLVRIPLVNGFNSSEEDALGFAEMFKNYCTDFCEYELLRYHEYGKDKWKSCGMEYKMENGFVSDESFKKFVHIFRDNGFKLVNT